ncbi:MAG: hypothetical protein ABI390_03835 [Daejeonella sp.]
MKKRIAIFSFLLLYLSATAGLAMNFHFCGETLSGIDFNSFAKEDCCGVKIKEDSKKGCCNNEHISLKVSDQQHALLSSNIPAAKSLNLFLLPRSFGFNNFSEPVFINTFSDRGPPERSVPLIIKNCVFLI